MIRQSIVQAFNGICSALFAGLAATADTVRSRSSRQMVRIAVTNGTQHRQNAGLLWKYWSRQSDKWQRCCVWMKAIDSQSRTQCWANLVRFVRDRDFQTMGLQRRTIADVNTLNADYCMNFLRHNLLKGLIKLSAENSLDVCCNE